MAAYSSTEMRGPVLFLVANGNRKILTKRYFYAPMKCFYLAAMPASRGQTELKGSEHTPSDASKPPRTTGGGYRVRLKWDFASANADRLRGKIAKKTRFLLSGNAGLLGSNPAQGKRIYPPLIP